MFPSLKHNRILTCIGIIILALPLVGCDEKYVNSRQEAESYAQANPDIPTENIYIRSDDGSEISLRDIEGQERTNNEPDEQEDEVPMIVLDANSGTDTEEVLKYEEPADSEQTQVELFNNNNISGVNNNGVPATFRLDKKSHVSELWTYHWNYGQGKEPGTISLQDQNGKSYGPWPASTIPGQGGVQNAYWKTSPNTDLPPGTYTVIDSDPATWAQNEETGGQGIAWALGWFVE